MTFNFNTLLAFFFLGTALFSSCGKENIDLTSEEEGNVNTVVVSCELQVTIAEQPPGSGMFYTNVSSGDQPYTYEWSTEETTPNISVTEEGNYTVQVIDAVGCIISSTVAFNGINDPCTDFSLALSHNGSGGLSVSITGGTAPYTYLWSTGGLTPDLTITEDGTYTIVAADATGCTITESITVTLNDPCFSLSTTISDSGDGELTATPAGGTPPYNYFWSTNETTNIITVTADGTYEVTVVDALGCTVSLSLNVVIVVPCAGSFTAIIAEQPPGSGDLYCAPNNGTPPYMYEWSTGETTPNISVNDVGTYSVTVSEEFGCTAVAEIEL